MGTSPLLLSFDCSIFSRSLSLATTADFRVLCGSERWEQEVRSCQVEKVKVEQSAPANGDAGLQLIVRQDNCSIWSAEWKIIWIYLKACGCSLKGSVTKAAVSYKVYDQIWCRNIDGLINTGKTTSSICGSSLVKKKSMFFHLNGVFACAVAAVFTACSCLLVQSCPELRPLCTHRARLKAEWKLFKYPRCSPIPFSLLRASLLIPSLSHSIKKNPSASQYSSPSLALFIFLRRSLFFLLN